MTRVFSRMLFVSSALRILPMPASSSWMMSPRVPSFDEPLNLGPALKGVCG